MSQIEDVLRDFRARVMAREDATVQDLTRRWLAVESRLEAQMTALAYEIEQAGRNGQVISAGKLARMERYQDLMVQVRGEVEQYQNWTAGQVAAGQRVYWNDGIGYFDEAMRVSLTTPGGIVVPWNRVPVDAVNALIGYAGDGTPLFKLLMADYQKTAAAITQELINAIALGWNPRKTARAIADAMAGNLQRALVVARTEQLRAFRAATQEGFARNADVLEGWQWHSNLDLRTCSICWGLHGSFHPVTEQMSDHVNGRCSMIPITKSWDEIGRAVGIDLSGVPETRVNVRDGDDLLRNKSEGFQRKLLGPGRFDLWQGGMNLRDMVAWKDDPEWGRSPVLRTLKELSNAS